MQKLDVYGKKKMITLLEVILQIKYYSLTFIINMVIKLKKYLLNNLIVMINIH